MGHQTETSDVKVFLYQQVFESHMNTQQFNFKMNTPVWLKCLGVMVFFCLLTACGGGGGGSASSGTQMTVSAIAPPPPAITLKVAESGDNLSITPSYKFGTGIISQTGSATQIQATSGSVISITKPTQTTTFKLTVQYQYQDPSTIKPSNLSGSIETTAVYTVTPAPTPIVLPTMSLEATSSGVSSTTDITVNAGDPVILNPTFTASPGYITKAYLDTEEVANYVNSNTTLTKFPTSNTTYTLKVCFYNNSCSGSYISTKTVKVWVVTVPGKITIGGNMVLGRSDHATANIPSSPLVLASGGTSDGTTVLKTSEVYDPVNNKWQLTGDMKIARRGHIATALQNGKILVTGGYDGKNALATAEIYDPSNGTWTATTGTMSLARRFHTATLLADGRVLIAGGTGVGNGDPKITELYDPIDGKFYVGTSLPEPRLGHTATLLNEGKVLITGNSTSGLDGKKTILFNYLPCTPQPCTDSSTIIPVGSMLNSRFNHTATSLSDGNILVTGGFGNGIAQAEIFNITLRSWSATASGMNARHALHTATLLQDGSVLIVGGYDGSTPINTIELYDGTSFGTGKTLNINRAMHTSALLPNGNVLIFGTYCPSSSATCTTSNTSEVWLAPVAP